MAGITAYFTTQPERHQVGEILTETVASAYPLPGSKPVVVPMAGGRIALGGSFPRHFQRKAAYAAAPPRTVLFYGELYNSLGGKEEAGFALDLVAGGTFDRLQELDGPFSLLCWDDREKTLTAATDRLGRFPLFLFVHEELTGVTTDLHSVFSAGAYPAALRLESVADFLTIGFPLGNKSMFEGVERIAGGTTVTISPAGVERRPYWRARYVNGPDQLDRMITTYEARTQRVIDRFPHTLAALSGGWDTRATWAVLKGPRERIPAMTFGVNDSYEVEVASAIARRLHLTHVVVEPDHEFFSSFPDLAGKVIMLGNGHLGVDLAFQLYAFERLAEGYGRILDSGGCEIRRGRRARVAARTALTAGSIASFLLSTHATGIWNAGVISAALFHEHETSTRDRLTRWLGEISSPRAASNPEWCAEQIDAFASRELWGHHYAHGYHLQTNVIACSMPYCDNEMYDLYLGASRGLRWSHGFQGSVIRRYAPELEQFPIVHGDHTIPYGDRPFSSVRALYYHLIRRMSSRGGGQFLNKINTGRPFRPYHRWYSRELKEYVAATLRARALSASGFVNMRGIEALLTEEGRGSRNNSHRISMLLTLSHLLSYVDRINSSIPRSGPPETRNPINLIRET